MSTSTEELRVKLLDARKAERELRSVRKELEQTSGATTKHGRSSRKAAEDHEHSLHVLRRSRGLLEYGGGLLGLSAVGFGLKDIFQGGVRAQEQQLLLQNALRQTGQGGSAHMAELEKAITRTTSHGGFGALEETEGIASFVRETRSSTQAVRLNGEAIALARGAHMDYGRALQVVRRIQTGQVGRLQQYLGIIQPVKRYVEQLTAAEKKRFPQKVKEAELLDKEATAQEANRRVLERYGGAVNVFNNSAAGSISNANNAFKRATEELGEKALPVITDVAKAFSEIITEAEEGRGIWGGVGHDISEVAGDLKDVWVWMEHNKGVAETLGLALGTVFGTEKILRFYSALKKLEIVGLISKLLGFGGLATAAEEAGTGVGVGLAAMLPEVAVVAASIAAIYEAAKHAEEIREFFGVAGVEHIYKGKGSRPAESAAALRRERRREVHELPLLEHDLKVDRARGHKIGPQQLQQLHELQVARAAEQREVHHHTHVTVKLPNGKVLAETVAHEVRHDPEIARPVAEGVTKYTQHRKARE